MKETPCHIFLFVVVGIYVAVELQFTRQNNYELGVQ